MRRILGAAMAAVLAVLAGGGQANAATQLGETFVPTGSCSPGTRIQTASPGGQYAAPTPGVITSWSFRSADSGSSPLKLKVARPAGAAAYTIVGESSFENVSPPSALYTFDTRIAVEAGDVLGLYVAPPSVFHCARTTPGFSSMQGLFGEDLDAGSTTTLSAGPANNQLGIAASLEADADADGFGDETQDLCPTDAATQGACPDTDPPETTITKGAPKRLDGRRAKFRFRADEPGGSFECKLDRRRWKACSSPRKVKRLQPGRHKFKVRATDAAQNTDPTPARDRFRVLG